MKGANAMTRMIRTVAFLTLGLVLTTAFGHAGAETLLKARGWTHETFGRLVLDGAEEVVQAIAIDGDQLIIEFKEPVTIDFGRALANLPAYVGSEPQAQSNRIAITLKQAVTLKSFINKGNQVIDLRFAPGEPGVEAATEDAPDAEPATVEVQPAPAAEPKPLPAALEPAPEPAVATPAAPTSDSVRVSREESAAGAKVAFEWPAPVEYQMHRSDRFMIIDLRPAGRIDAAQETAAFPEGEVRVEAPPGGGT